MSDRARMASVTTIVLTGFILTGCDAPITPPVQERSQYAVSASIVPEIVDRATGSVLGTSTGHWAGTAIARDGRFTRLYAGQTGPISFAQGGQSWTVDDTTLSQVLDDFGFTPEANPEYLTVVSPFVPVDTLESTVDGVFYENVYEYGDFGQPLGVSIYRSGELLTATTYTWLSVPTGGYQLYRVVTYDYSQPDVYVRTSITVTSGRVTVLTNNDIRWNVAVTDGHEGAPLILTRLNRHARPFLDNCASVAAALFLPSPLYAQSGSCLEAWFKFGLAVGGSVAATAAVVAQPSPLTIGIYVFAVGNLLRKGLNVGKACGYR